MIAKVATIEPRSNDWFKLPMREKCWKAKYPAMTMETIAPSCFPLPMEHIETSERIMLYNGQVWSRKMHMLTLGP